MVAVRAERFLFAPLRELSLRARWLLTLLGTLLVLLHTTWLSRFAPAPFGQPDVSFYINMANGRVDLVPQPFSSRPLAPLLARAIAAPAHWPVQMGFVVLGYVSLALATGIVLWLAMRTPAPRLTLIALVAVPFWRQSLHGMGLPDTLHAALLACLLLALATERVYVAGLLLLPLMVTRESTSLALVCLLVVAWPRLRWKGAALALGSLVVGAIIVRFLGAGNRGNPEHLPQALYMLGKVPWNLLRTVGIQPWSNLYPVLCATPAWQRSFHLGPVQAVGFCYWTANPIWQALDAFLTNFGLLPLAAFLLWRWTSRDATDTLLRRFCLLYGGVSFLLAPALGTWYTRLFGYGWPLALVAAPILLGETFERTRSPAHARHANLVALLLLGLHVWVCTIGDRFHHAAMTTFVAGLYVIAFGLLWAARERPSPAGTDPGAPLGHVVKFR